MAQVKLFIGVRSEQLTSEINRFLKKIKDCEIIDIMQDINDNRALITVVYRKDEE